MIKMPKKGTILAPSSLHLVLYQELLKQQDHYLSLQVLSLASFLDTFFPKKESETSYLIQVQKALENVPSTNDFYKSIDDPIFLEECLRFMRLAKTFSQSTWPAGTKKEKDLKVILNLLKDLELGQSEGSIPSLEDVYILRTPYSAWDALWVEQLLQAGAKWLDSKPTSTRQSYVSLGTPRKQAQWIAQTIVEKQWNAEDVLIACCDSQDSFVLEQMFEAYKIPYTLLKENHNNPILNQWVQAIQYLIEPSLKNFLQFVKILGAKYAYFEDYFALFPEAFPSMDLVHPAYSDNPFMNEKDWQKVLNSEAKIKDWMDKHPMAGLEDMAAIIQEANAPTQDNIQIFGQVQTILCDAIDASESKPNYRIALHQIKSLHQARNASDISGVLIGNKNTLCALRPNVFLCSAHADGYPVLDQETGIFNETYIMHTSLPSLDTRNKLQKAYLEETLGQVQNLIVTIPQANYQGEAYQESLDMKQFLGKESYFIDVKDPSIWQQPTFSIDAQQAKALYLKENTLHGSVSSFEKFVRCPLTYYLTYGLHLKEQKSWADLRTRGSILHTILEKLTNIYGEKFATCDRQVLQDTLNAEYAWLENTFPSKKVWISQQKMTLLTQLEAIFHNLAKFQDQWHMQISEQEKEFTMELPWDDYIISFHGYIDRIDTSDTSFMIFDYKSSEKEWKYSEFKQGLSLQLATYTIAYQKESSLLPLGHYYIALKTKPVKQEAIKVNYKRKKDNWSEISLEDVQNKSFSKLNGKDYEDVSIYADEKMLQTSKRDLSFNQMKEEWQTIVQSIAQDILSGQIQPNYLKDACKYCPYRCICRNARKEETKPNRLEVAE